LLEALTLKECNQIIGHRSRNTYTRYYIPGFINRDCIAINLSMLLRDDIVQAVGRLARNELALTYLTDTQKFEISNDLHVLELCCKRKAYTDKIKKALGFCTIKAAKGTQLYQRYKETQDKIKSLKQHVSNKQLKQAIDEFYKTIDTIKINLQQQGVMPTQEVLTLSSIKYKLEERRTVAKLLFQPINSLEASKVFEVRLQLIHSLIQLCNQYETPRQYKASCNLKVNIY
jgi:hypothetical protein